MVKSGQAVTVMATTSHPSTGAATDADSTPVGTLYVNGIADAATVTETKVATGTYSLAVTLPTLSVGDVVALGLTATVDSVAGAGIVWTDVAYIDATDALTTLGLDHLVSAAVVGTDVTDNSIIARMVSKSATADWDSFANQTDALEAIRDRGDLAWLTGAGAASDLVYAPASATRTVGDAEGGVLADLALANGTSFITGEVNSGTLLEVLLGFTMSTTARPAAIRVWGFYSGGAGHYVSVQALDVGSSTWETLGQIPTGAATQLYAFPLLPNHVNGTTGAVAVRFLHSPPGTGITSHFLSLDKVELTAQTVYTLTAQEIWEYATRTLSAFGFTPVPSNAADVTAIKAKTDNLPSDPADQSAVEAAITAAATPLAKASTALSSAVWTNTKAGYLDAAVSSVSGGTGSIAGPGADDVTLTITDDDDLPIADCEVWVKLEGGSDTIAGTLTTNDAGQVTFLLDAGVSYDCYRRKVGKNFTNPQTFTAVAD